MGKSCKEIAQSLYDCVKDTPCVKNGGDIRECLKDTSSSEECQALRRTYMECKRGSLDMKNRIRGMRYY